MQHENNGGRTGRLPPRVVDVAPFRGPATGDKHHPTSPQAGSAGNPRTDVGLDKEPRRLDSDLRIAVDSDEPTRRLNSDLRIAVDFDGVLFDHIPYLLRGFRDGHGIDLAAEGLRYWDFFQYRAVREKGLTWHCVSQVLEAIDTDPVIHELPPRDGNAASVMGRWRDAGHHVSIVTARHPRARSTTEAFLRRHGIPHDALVMGAAIKTGYDVLVDDAPHNVLMAAADGGLALLMDHPYNRDVPTHRNPLRVGDWLEVETCLARHLSNQAAVPA